MSRRVADAIGFGLDDAPADDAFGRLAHDPLADEKAGEGSRIDR